jgi:hypothetical protein
MAVILSNNGESGTPPAATVASRGQIIIGFPSLGGNTPKKQRPHGMWVYDVALAQLSSLDIFRCRDRFVQRKKAR